MISGKITLKREITQDGGITQQAKLDPPDMPLSEILSMLQFAILDAWDQRTHTCCGNEP